MRPIGIDLFAGAGGLSLGFERAGFDVAAAVEIDPIHCATHAFNFPHCKTVCRDVRHIAGSDILCLADIDASAEIAVVFGGAPCQGFSLIGKRALDDPRNALVHHFVRLVLELRPAYFVFENVKGLTVGRQRQVLDEMIAALAGDYDVLLPYRVLNAVDYGVPQNRRRLFLIGAKRGYPLPDYPSPRARRVTVREAIGDLPDADEVFELIGRDWAEASYGQPSDYARKMRGLSDDPEDFGYRRNFDSSIMTSSLRTAHTEKSRRRFAETQCGKVEPISRFLKLDPEGQCNTLRAGTASDRGAFTSPRPIHPHAHRVVTNREAARLHSYPDWFRFHVTKWHGFRQIGNSVPPLLGQAIAGEIIRALGVIPTLPQQTLALDDPKLLSLTMAEAAKLYGVPRDVIPRRRRVSSEARGVSVTL